MKTFVRDEALLTKMFIDSLDREVYLDALVEILYSSKHNKLKAYCSKTNTFLQFPTILRERGRKYIADIVKAKRTTGKVFYRAYPGSIRDNLTKSVLK